MNALEALQHEREHRSGGLALLEECGPCSTASRLLAAIEAAEAALDDISRQPQRVEAVVRTLRAVIDAQVVMLEEMRLIGFQAASGHRSLSAIEQAMRARAGRATA